MSSSARNPRVLALTGTVFAIAIASSLAVGAGLALMRGPAPICARISADTVGVVEGRDSSSMTLRIPASKGGSPHSCDGGAQ
jgi:hypothetical protein